MFGSKRTLLIQGGSRILETRFRVQGSGFSGVLKILHSWGGGGGGVRA